MNFESAITNTTLGVIGGAVYGAGLGALPGAIIGGIVGGIFGFTADAVHQAIGFVVPGYKDVYDTIGLITDPISSLLTIPGDTIRPKPTPNNCLP